MRVNQQIAHHFDTEFYAFLSLQDAMTIEHNYPQVWMDLYHQQHYAQHDPVLTSPQQHFLFWDDLDSKTLSQQQQHVMAQAQYYGIRSGLTFNCTLKGQHPNYFTLASFESQEKFKLKMQKQFTKILSFICVIYKNSQIQQQITTLADIVQDYSQLTTIERTTQRQKYQDALIKLTLLESKTMNLCVPQEIMHYIKTNYHQLRQLLLCEISKFF